MEEMREIVDIGLVHQAILIGGPLWLLVCLAVGLVGRGKAGAWLRAAAIGMLGPAVTVLWLLYSYLVRYDPETGYFGLDKLWVLALNAIVFVLVGALFGYGLRWVWARTAPPATEAEPVEGANQ